jgi:hypothetical protein
MSRSEIWKSRCAQNNRHWILAAEATARPHVGHRVRLRTYDGGSMHLECSGLLQAGVLLVKTR